MLLKSESLIIKRGTLVYTCTHILFRNSLRLFELDSNKVSSKCWEWRREAEPYFSLESHSFPCLLSRTSNLMRVAMAPVPLAHFCQEYPSPINRSFSAPAFLRSFNWMCVIFAPFRSHQRCSLRQRGYSWWRWLQGKSSCLWESLDTSRRLCLRNQTTTKCGRSHEFPFK